MKIKIIKNIPINSIRLFLFTKAPKTAHNYLKRSDSLEECLKQLAGEHKECVTT